MKIKFRKEKDVVANEAVVDIVANDSTEEVATNNTDECVEENGTIIKKIKKEVFKLRKEAEEKVVPFEKLYPQMVKEAVMVIEEEWKKSVERLSDSKLFSDCIESEAWNAFSVTSDMKLYSTRWPLPNNPITGKSCFFNVMQFPSSEDVEKFVDDVLSHLPKATCVTTSVNSVLALGECTNYTFSLKVDMT